MATKKLPTLSVQQQAKGSAPGKTKHGKRYNKKKAPKSPWVSAIDGATSVILKKFNNKPDANHRFGGVTLVHEGTREEIDHSLHYLHSLEMILHQNAMEWPPTASPLAFVPYKAKPTKSANHKNPKRVGSVGKAKPVIPAKHTAVTSNRDNQVSAPPPQPSLLAQVNAFQSLALSDDEEEEDDVDEAGDIPVQHTLSAVAKPFVPKELDTLRLLIRLYTSQADLYAHKARLMAKNYQWLDGANCLQSSIGALQNSVGLADSAIASYMMQEVAGASFFTGISSLDAASSRRKTQLQQDAKIVDIAAESVTTERNWYIRRAEQRLALLQHKLMRHWKGREEAMRKMGDKWFQNPSAKHDFSGDIGKKERELKALEETVDIVATQETEVLSVTAKHLKEKLQALWYQKNRYNGKKIKPTKNRLEGFGDPTDHQWIFTGSSDATVEFFEKQLVEEVPPGSGMMVVSVLKLDWFFQTGIAKMTLEHPVQGSIPLLDKVLTPGAFRQALTKPLAFTEASKNRKSKDMNGTVSGATVNNGSASGKSKQNKNGFGSSINSFLKRRPAGKRNTSNAMSRKK